MHHQHKRSARKRHGYSITSSARARSDVGIDKAACYWSVVHADVCFIALQTVCSLGPFSFSCFVASVS